MKHVGIAYIATGLALSACGGGNDEPAPEQAETPTQSRTADPAPSPFDALAAEAFSSQGGGVADVDLLLAAFGDDVSTSYDDLSFDEATGATVVEGLRISPAEEDRVALRFNTIRFWGLDAEGLLARVNGERTDETIDVFQRIDADGMIVEGLEVAYNEAFGAYYDVLEDIAEDLNEADAGAFEEVEVSFETYDISAARMIMSGLTLHPLQNPDLEGVDEDEALLRTMADHMRSISLEAAALYDGAAELDMRQYGERYAMTMDFDVAGYQGLDRGDLAYALAQGLTFSGQTPFPDFSRLDEADLEPGDPPPMAPVDISGRAGRYDARDMRFATLLDHAIRAEIPEMTETDLFSLGVYSVDDLTYMVGGAEVFALDSGSLDATQFEWLLPESLTADVNGLRMDFSGLRDPLTSLSASSETPETAALIEQAFDILASNDALDFAIDGAMSWAADADTGQSTAAYTYAVSDWGGEEFQMSMKLPTVARLAQDMEAPEADFEEVLDAAFEEDFAFNGLTYTSRDEGGLDRLFKLVVELAALAPEDQPQARALASYDPDGLRTLTATTIRVAGGAADAEAPGLGDIVQAAADFIEGGGSFTIDLSPPRPLTAADFELEDPAPDAIMDMIGLTARHTPPPAE